VARTQIQNIFTVEGFGTADIEEVHNRPAAGIVFQTEHVAEFVYGGTVQFSAAQLLLRSRTHSDLPVKIVPPRELRPRDDTVIQNVGVAIDDSYGASVEVGFFMEVRDEHAIPKTERSPKSIRPRFGGVDLDADISQHIPSQIFVVGARFIRAGPVGLRLFLCARRNPRGASEPHGYGTGKKLFAFAQAAPPNAA